MFDKLYKVMYFIFYGMAFNEGSTKKIMSAGTNEFFKFIF